MLEWSVKNIVATGQMNVGNGGLDLVSLSHDKTKGIELDYNHARFPALIIRCGFKNGVREKGMGTMLLFENGKATLTGCSTPSNVNNLVKKVEKLVGGTLSNKNIVNIVACGDFGHYINLENFFMDSIENAMYEPESFPALVFRTKHSTFLVFSSGKFVSTGTRDFEQAKEMITSMTKTVKAYEP